MNGQTDGHLLDDDDRPVGRVLTRREVLALFGLAGSTLIAACAPGAGAPAAGTLPAAATPTLLPEAATAAAIAADPTAQATAAAEVVTAEAASVPNCVVRPEMTEGPYFVDAQLNRSDVRVEPSDGSVKEGTPLTLAFLVSQIANGACTLLPGATVDIWHCDAQGVYSGVADPGFDTSAQAWLRGYQVTDAGGKAEFLTIYPGWYSGRAVHIHFKIRADSPAGAAYEFTSQLFFDEGVTAQVYSQPPYAARGLADVPNAADGIFRNGGDQMVLAPAPAGGGYAARFDIALDLANA